MSGNRKIIEKIRHLARFIRRIIQLKLSFIALTKNQQTILQQPYMGSKKDLCQAKNF